MAFVGLCALKPINDVLYLKKAFGENLGSEFRGGSDGKESACSADLGSISGSRRRPGEENGNPLQYSCPDNPMDRSLAGYGPCSLKESDTAEQLTGCKRVKGTVIKSH